MKRDLLTISDLGTADFEAIASRAVELGRCWRERSMPQTLAKTRVGLIEELPGWRNPSALSLGAAAMGATCVSINAKLEGSEAAEDLAGYLDNWFDLLGIRTPRLSSLRSFAGAVEASVVNLRTNDDHPCEILGVPRLFSTNAVPGMDYASRWSGREATSLSPGSKPPGCCLSNSFM
ncbi:hypothetical protein ABWH98_16845 [Labrenzia sp. ac12]